MCKVILLDGAAIEKATVESGPLVPVREAAELRGCSKQALQGRIHRGTVRVFFLLGHQFVSLKEALSD